MEMSLDHSIDNGFDLWSILMNKSNGVHRTGSSGTDATSATTSHAASNNDNRFIRSFSYFTDPNNAKDCLPASYISTNGTGSVVGAGAAGSNTGIGIGIGGQSDNFSQPYLNELFKEKFNDATVIISVIILVLINIIVIFGNILVILSVFVSSKLRTVTNFFIGKFQYFLFSIKFLL